MKGESMIFEKRKTQVALLKLYVSEFQKKVSARLKVNYELTTLGPIFSDTTKNTKPKILVVAHIFYQDQVADLLARLLEINDLTEVVVTTTSDDVRFVAEAYEIKFKVPFRIVELPNRGRNFGPLFEVMSSLETKFDYLLHVHGKKSLHTGSKLVASWVDFLYKNLLDPKNFAATIDLMQSEKSVGIAYPDVSSFVSKLNMCWGLNFHPVMGLALDLGVAKPKFLTSKLHFPAGGMFLLRLETYTELFESGITQDNFLEERGSIDGMMEHGIERLFGAFADSKGMSQVALNYYTNKNVKIRYRGLI
jgi:lipopolysaccharide biosynthesis protein